MTKRYLVLLTWFAAGYSMPVLAQHLGPEFRVNTYTTGYQSFPSVASDLAGNFVVVWDSRDGQDGSYSGVFGQRYDNHGNRLGTEFQVNTTTSGLQGGADIAFDPGGNFVVVWTDPPFGSGQRYDKDGNRLGTEFAVSEIPSNSSGGRRISSDATGNFVVVWNQDDVDGSLLGVFGQRFDRDSNRLGDTFQVNTFTQGYQFYPDVASDASGNFVVVWESDGQDGWFSGVFGQRYDSGGNPLGGEFRVNTHTPDAQRFPSVASDPAGNFVVVWDSGFGGDDIYFGIFGQRYDSDGNPLGDEFQVNTYTTFAQTEPKVTSDPHGNFVVVWRSREQDGEDYGTFGQRYDSEGNRLGGEFQVNTYTTRDQKEATVASDGAGNFVIVWASETQDGGYGDQDFGIFGRRFLGGCRSTASNPTFLCSGNPR